MRRDAVIHDKMRSRTHIYAHHGCKNTRMKEVHKPAFTLVNTHALTRIHAHHANTRTQTERHALTRIHTSAHTETCTVYIGF